MLGNTKIGTDMIAVFRKSKISYWRAVHAKVLFLPVRSKREWATSEKQQINLQ